MKDSFHIDRVRRKVKFGSSTRNMRSALVNQKPTYQLKKEMIHSKLMHSQSKFRRRCYRMRKDMILYPSTQFVYTLLTGAVIVVTWISGFIIIHQRFYETNKRLLDVKTPTIYNMPDFSQSLIPMIGSASGILLAFLISAFSLTCDTFYSGFPVWNRDNLGVLLQYIIFHGYILWNLITLKQYVQVKEMMGW